MKKGVAIVAAILVLAGIGSALNKKDAPPEVETRAMISETATATPRPSEKPTPKPSAAPTAAASEAVKEPEIFTLAPMEPETPAAERSVPAGRDYVLNTNTLKFHYPTCSSVGQMKAANRKDVTMTRDEIVAMGYSPCGRCHP